MIEVHYHERVGEGPQYGFHQPHEGYGGIFQCERHDESLEKVLHEFKGILPHIEGFNKNLVIPDIQVNLVEIFGLLELVQKVINMWDWVPIPNNVLIYCLIVNTQSPGHVLLLY